MLFSKAKNLANVVFPQPEAPENRREQFLNEWIQISNDITLYTWILVAYLGFVDFGDKNDNFLR